MEALEVARSTDARSDRGRSRCSGRCPGGRPQAAQRGRLRRTCRRRRSRRDARRAAAGPPRRARGCDQSLFAARRSATSSALPSTSASSRCHASRSQISRWSPIPEHDDLARERRVRDERRGDHHAALFVEFGLGRSREEVPLELPRLLAERIQRGESRLDESNPILTTVGIEAPLDAAFDDDPARKGFAEPGGKGETVLVIDRVLVGTEEHPGSWFALPLYPTLPHANPLVKDRYNAGRDAAAARGRRSRPCRLRLQLRSEGRVVRARTGRGRRDARRRGLQRLPRRRRAGLRRLAGHGRDRVPAPRPGRRRARRRSSRRRRARSATRRPSS